MGVVTCKAIEHKKGRQKDIFKIISESYTYQGKDRDTIIADEQKKLLNFKFYAKTRKKELRKKNDIFNKVQIRRFFKWHKMAYQKNPRKRSSSLNFRKMKTFKKTDDGSNFETGINFSGSLRKIQKSPDSSQDCSNLEKKKKSKLFHFSFSPNKKRRNSKKEQIDFNFSKNSELSFDKKEKSNFY